MLKSVHLIRPLFTLLQRDNRFSLAVRLLLLTGGVVGELFTLGKDRLGKDGSAGGNDVRRYDDGGAWRWHNWPDYLLYQLVR
jgi:hypothetical protein